MAIEDWDKDKILKAYNLKSKQHARSLAAQSLLNVAIENIDWECCFNDIDPVDRIMTIIESVRKQISENESKKTLPMHNLQPGIGQEY